MITKYKCRLVLRRSKIAMSLKMCFNFKLIRKECVFFIDRLKLSTYLNRKLVIISY